MNQSAKEAFKSYVRAYDSHQLKTIFNVDTLDLAKVAKSFGFTVPPVVDLSKYFTFAVVKIPMLMLNFVILYPTELTHKIRSRPEKRVGGGGYGHFKEMNKDKGGKARKFKQVGRNDANKKKFTR